MLVADRDFFSGSGPHFSKRPDPNKDPDPVNYIFVPLDEEPDYI